MLTADEILEFWFSESGPKKWFSGGPEFDEVIRQRFEAFTLDVAKHLRDAGHHDWQSSPEGALALIIALDQFTRNMFRDTARMFADDDLALALAKAAIANGFDLAISPDRRAFVYMPFMHSEALADQDFCVKLMGELLEGEGNLKHAIAHRKLIEQFGRFAHRNAILGRTSTAQEVAYLNSDAYRP